nr:hypothetical protein [Tanacetum cinerariifolium]
VLEIYMQEFWVTATVHYQSIQFKMDNKKHIVNLESFKEMLHICPRLPHQPFVEPPFKEKILAFLRFLGHSGAIRNLTDAEHIDTKKSNEMYYPRFTKVIIYHFTSKDPSILRRNKVNWHYVRDDHMFTTIKLVSRHQNTQQFSALLPIELTNEDIKNSNAYKEYYAVATGATPPKPKASVRKTRINFDTIITPPTAAACPRLTTSEKDKQAAKASKAKNEGTGSIPGVLDVPNNKSKEEISWNSTNEEGNDDEGKDDDGDDEGNNGDDGNGEENLRTNVGREEGHDEEEEEDELYRDVNINLGRGIQLGIESIFETTSQMDVHTPTSVALLPMSAPTLTSSTISTITTTQQAPLPPTTAPSTLLQDLPNFGSLFGFDHQLKTLEANFSEFTQTNQFAEAVSSIPGIVHRYMDQWINEAVQVAIQIQSDYLRDEAQAENDEFLKTIDENKQKIIKEHVKEQVKRNLYKAFVEAYESDKIILDTYGYTVTLKRRRDDDADKDEEPSAGSDRGSKRRREGKELESASALQKKATRSAGKSTQVSKSRQTLANESTTAEEPMQTTFEMEEPSHPEFETGADDQPIWTHYPRNLLKPLPLIPNNRGRRVIPFDHFINNDLEYLRGGASSRKYTTSITKTKAADYRHIKWIEDLVPRTMWIQEPIGYDKHALWRISHWGRKRQQFYGFAVNRESARDVYSKRRIIVVTELKIVEWHKYNYLDWITVRRDDDKLYKFKEGDFKRLRIQDIEDMRVEDLQLDVESYQKKLNLTKSDTYRSDLKHKEAYIVYSNPRGFIYQNKDKKNMLIRIDELHKFSDGTLADVRTALDDRLKGIRMKYLPQSIWRKSDKDRAAAMIQAIDKRLKTRRIMRSLERFVRGRLYEGDFRMLQRTI